ncbi:GNAT family N-acetyltransferase [Microvirga massiliensis]|uniref:GNAT family N-acetyltransferase n=1 Tax=Microvirga massiliensis TaxID=1033741 RepID=UPI00062BEC3C|nr:GNAT family N-acetyltransferase [Microvirga massiliensis]
MPPVRLARPDDLDKLAEIERSAASVFRDVGLAWVADGETMNRHVLEAACRDGTLWVAADSGGEPVGFLAAHALDGRLYIAEVSVARSHQRQGIGGALVAAAVGHARRSGFPAVTLTTYRDLSWNGPFYARLGFEEVDPDGTLPGHMRKVRAEAGHDPSRRCLMVMSLDGEGDRPDA